MNTKKIADAALWNRYQTAKEARARWAAEEKATKAELLATLGYDPDDEKPAPADVFGPDGTRLGSVRVGTRKGLDVIYLRDHYPAIYAECEKWTYPISFRT